LGRTWLRGVLQRNLHQALLDGQLKKLLLHPLRPKLRADQSGKEIAFVPLSLRASENETLPRDMREPRRFAIRVLHWGKPTPGIDAVTRLCLAVLA
jgi:hypothetical protein